MVTDRVGPTITTLKAEVDFLSDELRQAKAENKQLLEENSSLSTWQCVYTDGKTGLAGDEHGNQYCAMARENERLLAANRDVMLHWDVLKADYERLRAALREVMDDLTLISKNHWLPVGLLDDVIYVNARAALEGK